MNQVVHVSRNTNNGTNAGTFNVNANNDSSNANRNIGTQLANIGLEIKPSWNIYDVHKNGIDFVGFVFRPTDTRLRPTIATKFKNRCIKLRQMLTSSNCAVHLNALMAYKGWVKSVNAKQLWRKHSTQFTKFFPKQLRGAV